MNTTIVENEFMAIRVFRLTDAKQLFELIDENRSYIGEWLRFANETLTIEDTKKFIEKVSLRFENNNGFWAGIWMNNILVGSIGLLHIDWDNKNTEIGYYLSHKHEGKGIITKACRLLIDFIFTELQLNRIEISAIPENIRSRKIPERLGFVQEGIKRQEKWFSNRFVDKVIYGLLREEWSTKNSS